MANSVDLDQTAPIAAVCSGSTLFASILNSSLMLGNYLQQTTSVDFIFRCIFFLGTLRVNPFLNIRFSPFHFHTLIFGWSMTYFRGHKMIYLYSLVVTSNCTFLPLAITLIQIYKADPDYIHFS